jgi:outer membrane protein assembly factor BamB
VPAKAWSAASDQLVSRGPIGRVPVVAAGLDSPELAGSVVCTSVGSATLACYAVDVATGSHAWTRTIGDTLAPFAAGLGLVYCTTSAGITALSSATGKVRWTSGLGYGGGGLGIVPNYGQYDGGMLYTSGAVKGSSEALVLALDGATGRTRWTFRVPQALSALTVVDGVVYAGWPAPHPDGPGEIVALDAASGACRWTAPHSPIPAYLVVTSGVVVSSPYQSTADTCGLDARTGQLLWRTAAGWATDMTAGNGIIYRAAPRYPLQALDARTGRQLWTRSYQNQVVFVALDNDVLFADSFRRYARCPPPRVTCCGATARDPRP